MEKKRKAEEKRARRSERKLAQPVLATDEFGNEISEVETSTDEPTADDV
jgi:hypothetical protein